jgi:hypothetical protein
MPHWQGFVCLSRCHIEHDDGRIGIDVLAIAQASELFLTSTAPEVKADLLTVAQVENQRVHFDPDRRHVAPLKVTRKVSFHKGRFAHAAIANDANLEGGQLLRHFFLRFARESLTGEPR